MKLSWVHRVRWHEIHWYLTVFACRPDKRPWGLVCPFPDRDRSSLSCVIRVFFHQLTAGIRAQNAHHYIGDSWVGKSDSSVCWWNTAAHLFDCVGVFRDICFLWRQCCPFDSAFSVNHIRVFLTLEEKTRPSGECEILFEDPLRTSLSNKTKQGASVVTNRIAFFKDESLWFSHEV